MDYVMAETGQCVAVGKIEKCSSYAYSTEEMNVTITTENNLVCSQGRKADHTYYVTDN